MPFDAKKKTRETLEVDPEPFVSIGGFIAPQSESRCKRIMDALTQALGTSDTDRIVWCGMVQKPLSFDSILDSQFFAGANPTRDIDRKTECRPDRLGIEREQFDPLVSRILT
jgi:hypothetical protein